MDNAHWHMLQILNEQGNRITVEAESEGDGPVTVRVTGPDSVDEGIYTLREIEALYTILGLYLEDKKKAPLA